MPTAISVKDIRKSYGDLRAVDGVTFEVGHGEFFGILGPNGAGKTTATECLYFMDEVEELCDRVAILEQGRIAALDTPTGLVDRIGGEYRLRFRPMAPLDEQSLITLPGVTAANRRGAQVTVTGTGDFASAVTAELARRQVLVADLRIEGRSLDSAYVALTGRSMES